MPNFKVKAVYEYSSPHEDDLTFSVGQIITVTELEGDDWYVGEYIDDSGNRKDGLFPKNFVEKYEPEPPPRPNRTSRYKPLEQPQTAPAPPTPEVVQQEAPAPQQEAPVTQKEEPAPSKPQPPPVEIPTTVKSPLSPITPKSAHSAKSVEAPQEAPATSKPPPAQPAAAPAAAPAAKKAPPPVAAKSNAFRDRIAAFNQPAAAPIAPFKPGGAPSTFIKKPFVAPPPSRHAYVPPPTREQPPVKTYRREEDPEIAERQAQDMENAERAGLSGPSGDTANGDEEDQPKPTSLKERIALLQKQQAEQAQRAAATQKEKPRKPPMKQRTESYESGATELEGPPLEQVSTADTKERGSIDHSRPPRSAGGFQATDASHSARDLHSDANDADQSGAGETEDAGGSSTSVDDDEVRGKPQAPRAPGAPPREPNVGDEEGAQEEDAEEEEEEDEMDAETRRKLELRERMAKMSGGMGMGAMFGPPGGLPMGGLPPKKKKPAEKKSTGDSEEYPQQRVPMFAIPGMQQVKSPEAEDKRLEVEKEDEIHQSITRGRAAEEVPDVEDVAPPAPQRTLTGDRPPPIPTEKRPVPPPVPHADRPVPPPVPSASRPVPPPIRSPTPGSESGDELTDAQANQTGPPGTSGGFSSKRSSMIAPDEQVTTSPDRRVPPIPFGSPPMSPTSASRPPPPPPPTAAPPSRQGTIEVPTGKHSSKVDREGESEYEGDYDTDIAPGATHKDALKAHTRESSQEESTTADDTPVHSPKLPTLPPLPPTAPRNVPPPLPQHAPHRQSMDARRSIDVPRVAPPPPPIPPPSRDFHEEDDDDYDPFRYNTPSASARAAPPPAPRAAPPPPQSQPPPPQNRPPPPAAPPLPPMIPPAPHHHEESSEEDDLYSAPPPRKSHDRPPPPPPQAPPPPHQVPHRPPPPPVERVPPPPPPPESSQPARAPARKSLDVNRSLQQGRASMDQPRPSVSQDYMASEVDSGASTHWWTQPNMAPPTLQGRKDILVQTDEARCGDEVEKIVSVLFMDYSQTVLTARFNPSNVSDVQLEQRQEPPPARLRQDQLETAHEQFGQRIAKEIESKQNTVVGDGTPHGLINELLRNHASALRPVSTRSFGALVYANLANASTQQYDEIRPGDIISFRNAKFQGKHGAMHAKYSVDVGKPDHVGVVMEWDGSKKKVRVWEQGRESKKVKPESFRMGDLRSGEVRVWRVMSRNWVGWN
ncbi:hypothetical protein BU24DRAFT_418814 [Aaosphaeria arxii CBS 175.79]|uniref:SH3 domain-containing protein n=1 Tax=Aaosphaeria arxii CBS 175.79 TaxID=1450172 RepID=A0A6A5Y2F7_9PLEO|nr:uncharacterized protein BU24DRAFT_418814 [Aaosphaeria arxii CBS 175.79]KAF2019227.1 hypothetical protein BU24DRAFT_418814 [Aaosphaeria arxii CBS 175.79]